MYTLHPHFCTFGINLCAQAVLINKISASEISSKFIKSALLVGCLFFFLFPPHIRAYIHIKTVFMSSLFFLGINFKKSVKSQQKLFKKWINGVGKKHQFF